METSTNTYSALGRYFDEIFSCPRSYPQFLGVCLDADVMAKTTRDYPRMESHKPLCVCVCVYIYTHTFITNAVQDLCASQLCDLI